MLHSSRQQVAHVGAIQYLNYNYLCDFLFMFLVHSCLAIFFRYFCYWDITSEIG